MPRGEGEATAWHDTWLPALCGAGGQNGEPVALENEAVAFMSYRAMP
jgi:hypothetical protein